MHTHDVIIKKVVGRRAFGPAGERSCVAFRKPHSVEVQAQGSMYIHHRHPVFNYPFFSKPNGPIAVKHKRNETKKKTHNCCVELQLEYYVSRGGTCGRAERTTVINSRRQLPAQDRRCKTWPTPPPPLIDSVAHFVHTFCSGSVAAVLSAP